jgi:mRNA-degrading endonuclease RelE of RelBE toxin-antitoxin system
MKIVWSSDAIEMADYFYRFRLINDRFKLIYRIVDEDNILIFAVWDMKQDPNKLRLFI